MALDPSKENWEAKWCRLNHAMEQLCRGQLCMVGNCLRRARIAVRVESADGSGGGEVGVCSLHGLMLADEAGDPRFTEVGTRPMDEDEILGGPCLDEEE